MEWNVMESWNHGIMESWNNGIMESWNHGKELNNISRIYEYIQVSFYYINHIHP